jgi:EAL domain-containing protein (putative c-di-GMP-specific phosphodiesterase class I)
MSSTTRAGTPAPETSLESIGRRLRNSAPALRMHLCALHDGQGDVLWLSEGFLGPDEHCAVLAACETFPDPTSSDIVVEEIEEGRCAVVLRASTIAKRFVGAAMLIVEARASNSAALIAQLRTPAVGELMREFAWLRAPVTPAVTVSHHGGPLLDIGATAIGRCIDLPIPATQVAPEVDRLCAALRRTEISLYVQRIASLQRDAGLRRYEVLLRSGTDREHAPTKMLARATKAGLASMIDRRVFTTLLGWLVKHRAAWASEPAQFSMNLSATALRDKHFCYFLQSCISKASVPRETFAFEVSERDCLANLPGVTALAKLLGDLGCPLAVDDFSCSRESLVLLKVPGISIYKFSDRLSASIGGDRVDRDRLRKLIGILRALGKTTIAKHVNNPEHSRALGAYGVDCTQSYAASRPCALESLVVVRATASSGPAAG